ncbi:hypothetical protein K474DRAFT_611922 [Panus rudis PR-1116 ss-1]|nr:hypothetical protein K474DRAFT_611922 [Panus rudis PR-1116 ss-1]
MEYWPLELSSVVTSFFEEFSMAEIIKYDAIEMIIYYFRWAEKYPAAEPNQSIFEDHTPSRLPLYYLEYLAGLQPTPGVIDMVLLVRSLALVQLRCLCLGKRDDDATPAAQVATICSELGLHAAAQLLQDPRIANVFERPHVVSSLFSTCAHCHRSAHPPGRRTLMLQLGDEEEKENEEKEEKEE